MLYSESINGERVAIGNPCPAVVDGRVFIAFCRDNKQVLTLHSLDAEGTTWPSKGGGAAATFADVWATDITPQVFGGKESVGWVATGPPASFVTPSGRLLIPYDTSEVEGEQTSAGTIYSDDNGSLCAPAVGPARADQVVPLCCQA